GMQTRTLLEHMSLHCVLKHIQADFALTMINNSTDARKICVTDRSLAKECSDAVTAAKKEYANVVIQPNRVTVAWLAGFADAEGCLTSGTSHGRVQKVFDIAQSGSPALL